MLLWNFIKFWKTWAKLLTTPPLLEPTCPNAWMLHWQHISLCNSLHSLTYPWRRMREPNWSSLEQCLGDCTWGQALWRGKRHFFRPLNNMYLLLMWQHISLWLLMWHHVFPCKPRGLQRRCNNLRNMTPHSHNLSMVLLTSACFKHHIPWTCPNIYNMWALNLGSLCTLITV